MRIILYGDSNTYGYDPRGPIPGRYDVDKIWPGILEQYMGQGTEVIADGLNGRKIPSNEYTIEILFNWIRQNQPVDVLGIMLGTNDYLFDSSPNVEKVTERMESLLLELKANFQDIKLLLIAPPHIETGHIPYMEKYDTTDGCLSRAYEQLARKLGIAFADAGYLGLAYDGVHLTITGHQQLAKTVSNIFSK